MFCRLKYPDKQINSTITRFIVLQASDRPVSSLAETNTVDPVRVVLPLKDQVQADSLSEPDDSCLLLATRLNKTWRPEMKLNGQL